MLMFPPQPNLKSRALCLAVLFFITAFGVGVAPAGIVRDVRLAQHDSFTRAVIEYSGEIRFRVSDFSRARREVIIDLDNVTSSSGTVSTTGEEVLVKGGTVAFDAANRRSTVRLRTTGEVAVEHFQLENPARIVFDFKQASTQVVSSAPPRTATTATSSSRRRIIIDPGHGGHHKGGVGKLNGRQVYEKEVTRAVAFRVEKMLQADPRFDVFLTIRKDEYLGLGERTQIASQLKGDLFVSIHTNAVDGDAAQRRAKGFEIWTWNRQGNQSAAAKAVERMENDDPGVNRGNTRILTSMMMDALESQALESRHLANAMKDGFTRHSYFRNNFRGVDSARFKVLEVYDMPSVLLELGFITHPEEVKLLFSDSFQQTCAQSIYEGIVLYFERNDPSFGRAGERSRLAKGN